MTRRNERCPLQEECERSCKMIGHERDCDYYVNNRYCTSGIPDQDEILAEEETRREREWEEKRIAELIRKESETVIYQDPATGRLYRVSPKPENGTYVMQYRDPAESATWKWCANWNVGNIYRESLEELLEARAMREGWEPVEDAPGENPTTSAAVTAAGGETAAAPEVSDSASMTAADAAETNEPKDAAAENALAGVDGSNAFDYSGLDAATVDSLHIAERIIRTARQKYIVDLAGAVSMAHAQLCSTGVRNSDSGKFESSEDTFIAWCRFMGISKTTAYQLLQVQSLISGSTPEEQAALETASPSLLYAAAKPSAPAELVQAVRDGDITTHKQYQEALSEIRARDAKIAELLEMSEAADRRADAAEQAAKNAQRREEEARAAAHRYHVQAEDITAHRNALLDQQAEYITRIQELENRPVEVAVAAPNPAEVERLAGERAAEMTAQLSERLREAEAGARQLRAHAKSLEVQMKAGQRTPLTIANLQPMAQDLARSVTVLYDTFQLAACELRGDDYARCAAPLADALQDALTGLRGTVNERGANIYQEDEDFE